MNLRIFLTSLSLLNPATQGAQPDGVTRPVDAVFLDHLRQEVHRDHPGVLAARAREAAAQAAVKGVRLWEDPAAGVSAMAARPAMRREDGDLGLMVEQTLPRPKLYEAKRAKALTDVRVREALTQATVTELEADVAKTALELAFSDELVRLQREEIAWLESMSVTARDQLADPQSSASAPLRLESEQARKRQTLTELVGQRQATARRLNLLLGRPLDTPWPYLALPSRPGTAPDLASTLKRLAQRNPDLRGLFAMADAAQAEVAIAERERAPVFSIGADTNVYSGGSLRSAGVAVKMTLPWLNDHVYQAAIRKARLEEEAARHEIDSARRELEAKAIDALTRLQTAADQSGAFVLEVIPATEKAAEAVEAAWISSQATLLETLDARRAVLMARIDERRFMSAHLAALEDLRALIPPPPAQP